MALFEHRPGSPGTATVAVDPTVRGPPVDPRLYAKFGEHLYSARNLRNALDAGRLYNPTFAAWKFQVRSPGPDGGRPAEHDPDAIDERIDDYVDNLDLPGADRLREAYRSGAALWWVPVGDEASVTASPDVGVAGDRAQRIEVAGADEPSGLATWCYLPLHRTRSFEVSATARAADPTRLEVAIAPVDDDGALGDPLASATVDVAREWGTTEVDLDLPADADDDPDAVYAVAVRAPGDANVVVDMVTCYPDDHRDRADPEVVDLLAEADLPLLRWPGGNFVSGYRWRDGVGPIEERPTRPNPAWDGVEPNLFGTAEFVALCERVGCEPMICLNAGDGSPEEAADWVEYCNGSTDTEMGALRAEHGHPEPFDVQYWEVGNEVYGHWQTSWTTPEGYADRFRRFHEAMTAVDDSIEVLACGNRLTDWNDPLLRDCADDLDWLTDHVLVGGAVDGDTDPLELLNAYCGFPRQLGEEYAAVERAMDEAGVEDPRLAITELQLFAYPGEGEDAPSREALPTSDSIAEALYDATVLNECVRRGDFVRMVTHSGTGNHGGGLRTAKARVWADPCYYHHAMGTALFDGTPLGVAVTCDTYSTDLTVGADTGSLFGQIDPLGDAPVVDALAVLSPDETELTVVLVHCDATAGPVDVTLDLGDLRAAGDATVRRLAAESLAERNSLEDPEAVAPTGETVAVDGAPELELAPLSLVHVTVPVE